VKEEMVLFALAVAAEEEEIVFGPSRYLPLVLLSASAADDIPFQALLDRLNRFDRLDRLFLLLHSRKERA